MPTSWEVHAKIKAWARGRGPKWLVRLVEMACQSDEDITPDSIEILYQTFLSENSLSTGEIPSIVEVKPSAMFAEKTPQAPTMLKLRSISDVTGVNALCPDQKLVFGDALTVIYGHNGSGKTGYVRILKRACGARTHEDIWTNVHERQQRNVGSANITLVQGGKEQVVNWTGD